MTVTVLVSLTGYMLIAGIITASSTTHSLCLQQVSQLVVFFIWWGDPSILQF